MKKIREIPAEARPRERLLTFGSAALNDEELLAIILGSGGRDGGVFELSKRALAVVDKQNGLLSPEMLTEISGIGTAKATLICAALEFARRRIRPKGVKISASKDILPLVRHLGDRKQEHFVCISLNGAHEVIATRIITIGLVNSTQIHPREVFSDALSDRASAIVIAHNHPSGNVAPSNEDRRVTRILCEAAKVLGIKLLDHVVFSENDYYSFADEREL